MTIVGVTGHSSLDGATTGLVRGALTDVLRSLTNDLAANIVGVTCLARGADQVFADVVLELGGTLEIVVPATDYFERIPDPAARARCDAYLATAVAVHHMPFGHANWDAYLAASRAVVDRCETLIAVWDGSNDSGTGAAVALARDVGREIVVVWPDSASRR